MPLYGYTCRVCGCGTDEFRPVAKRHDSPLHCGEPMSLDVCGPAVHPDIEPYFDDQLGRGIRSRQHRKAVMREMEVYDKRDFKGHKWRKNNPAYKG